MVAKGVEWLMDGWMYGWIILYIKFGICFILKKKRLIKSNLLWKHVSVSRYMVFIVHCFVL